MPKPGLVKLFQRLFQPEGQRCDQRGRRRESRRVQSEDTNTQRNSAKPRRRWTPVVVGKVFRKSVQKVKKESGWMKSFLYWKEANNTFSLSIWNKARFSTLGYQLEGTPFSWCTFLRCRFNPSLFWNLLWHLSHLCQIPWWTAFMWLTKEWRLPNFLSHSLHSNILFRWITEKSSKNTGKYSVN